MSERQKGGRARAGRPAIDPERRGRTGRAIRQYRLAAGLDQAALAARLGYTKTAVGNWELGLTRPDLDVLPRLCEVLGVPVTELLGLPPQDPLAEEDRALLQTFRRLDRYNRRTAVQLMDRLLFQQDRQAREKLRSAYTPLSLFEEAAAAGIGAPMTEDGAAGVVYALRARVPGGADCVIRVNGASMEPAYPDGSFVYVNSRQPAAYGQTGIFIVNGEAFIKDYRPEGLVSRNRRYRTIYTGEGADVRCCGRVTGLVGEGDLASGSLLEKIETAFEEK